MSVSFFQVGNFVFMVADNSLSSAVEADLEVRSL